MSSSAPHTFEFVNGPVSKRSRRIPREGWERWKDVISSKYNQGYTLKTIQEEMLEQHGFQATYVPPTIATEIGTIYLKLGTLV
jgi:hypothetical protein